MLGVILTLLILPLAASGACALLPGRQGRPGRHRNVRRGQLRPGPRARPGRGHHDLSYLGYLRVDALSAIFLLATAFLYDAVSVYSIGYVRHHGHGDHYARRFYAGLNVFAWSMLAAPLMSSLALLWIAVEITTMISALLVAIEESPTAPPRPRGSTC